jgi:signal transduction histidine kinase
MAVAVAAILLAAFALALPFARVPAPPIYPLIPVYASFLLLNNLATATQLLAQYSISRSRALLALACGYLFTSFLMVPFALTFPGAFSATGLLSPGPQTSGLISLFWHCGFPVMAIAYALLKDREPTRPPAASPRGAIVRSIVSVVVIVCALTWIASTRSTLLPDGVQKILSGGALYHALWAPFVCALNAIALVALWRRRRSLLDLWLLLVSWSLLLASILMNVIDPGFNVGWYVARSFEVSSSLFLLLVLLAESTFIYANFVVAIGAERRMREEQLATLDAVVGSIAHEIRQPLASITANGSAGLRWLGRTPPDLEEVRASLKRIVSDGHRAADAIGSIRAMLRKGGAELTALDINELVRGAVTLLHGDLVTLQIAVHYELAPQLPPVRANRSQINQVLLNLVKNAADAMNPVSDRPRRMRIKTAPHEGDGVLISIEDNGIGIDPQTIDRLFDAFYTTKSGGTGLGLAICRSIIVSHGGRLTAAPAVPHGSVFNIVLPIDGMPGKP